MEYIIHDFDFSNTDIFQVQQSISLDIPSLFLSGVDLVILRAFLFLKMNAIMLSYIRGMFYNFNDDPYPFEILQVI